MPRFSHLLSGALALCLLSSQTARAEETIGTYAGDRIADFADIFRLRAGFPQSGQGLGIKARATTLAQAGFVTFNGKYIGIDRRAIGLVQERRTEGGISLAYGSINHMQTIVGNGFLEENWDWAAEEDRRVLRNNPYWDDGRQRYLSIGAELATPLAALDLGLYPEEAADFILGFATIDFYNDDLFGDDAVLSPQPNAEPKPDPAGPFRERQAAFDAEKQRLAEAQLESEEAAQRERESAATERRSARRKTFQPTPVVPEIPVEEPPPVAVEEAVPVTPETPGQINAAAAEAALKALEEPPPTEAPTDPDR